MEQKGADVAVVEEVETRSIQLDDRLKDAMATEGQGEEFNLVIPGYKTAKRGNMSVTYATHGDDYIYQLAFATPPNAGFQDIISAVVSACSTTIPEHIEVYMFPPNDMIEIFTVRAEGAAKLLGAKQFMEEVLVQKLLKLDLW